MASPNFSDPLDHSIADHWRKDKEDAMKTAKQWTHVYAKL